MSMHKIPLTDIEYQGLVSHGLDIHKPSQLSDAFRQGVAWAITQLQLNPEETTVEALEYRATKGSLGWVGGYDDEGYHKESLLVIEHLKNNI